MPKLWPLVGFGCLRSTPRLTVWEDLYRSLDEGGGEDHDDSLLCRRRSEPKRFIFGKICRVDEPCSREVLMIL